MTGFVCPILYDLSTACASVAGFQLGSSESSGFKKGKIEVHRFSSNITI